MIYENVKHLTGSMCDRVFPFIYLINIFISRDANVSEFKFEYVPLRKRVRQSMVIFTKKIQNNGQQIVWGGIKVFSRRFSLPSVLDPNERHIYLNKGTSFLFKISHHSIKISFECYVTGLIHRITVDWRDHSFTYTILRFA